MVAFLEGSTSAKIQATRLAVFMVSGVEEEYSNPGLERTSNTL